MNVLFMDVETTGQDPFKHTIIEIAMRLDVNGQKVDEFQVKLFNPQTVTNLQALKYNGTKLSDLLKHKQEIEAVTELVDWLLQIQAKYKGDLHICGQNVGFDIRFLWSMLNKYSIEGLDQVIGYKIIDTFGLAVALQHVGKLKTADDKLNLKAIAQALGVDLSNRKLHTAMDDVDVTAEVLYGLLKLMKA